MPQLDRTIRLWSADSGELLTALLPAARGYSSLDFDGSVLPSPRSAGPPSHRADIAPFPSHRRYIVSGSSDSKVRQIDLLDPREGLGRTFDRTACTAGGGGACACRCGSAGVAREGHTDLVRPFSPPLHASPTACGLLTVAVADFHRPDRCERSSTTGTLSSRPATTRR